MLELANKGSGSAKSTRFNFVPLYAFWSLASGYILFLKCFYFFCNGKLGDKLDVLRFNIMNIVR